MSFKDERDALRARFLGLLDEVENVGLAARGLGVNVNTAYGWARQAGKRSVRQARPHPRQAEFAQLRASGLSRREAAARVGIHERTAKDWDRGVRRSRGSRFYPDGRRVDYTTGETTMESMTSPPPLIPEQIGQRLLSLPERERIADLKRLGWSLRAIGRELGRAASTIKRELDARSTAGAYLCLIRRIGTPR